MRWCVPVLLVCLFALVCRGDADVSGSLHGKPLQPTTAQARAIEDAAAAMLRSASYETKPFEAEVRAKTALTGTYVRIRFSAPRVFVSTHDQLGSIEADEIIVCTTKEEDGNDFHDYVMVCRGGVYRAFAKWDPKAEGALWKSAGDSVKK